MKLISALISSFVLLVATASYAHATTALNAHWTCKTNASSSSVERDKTADKQMNEHTKSAKDAFSFAAKNCRDCTKITCESNS